LAPLLLIASSPASGWGYSPAERGPHPLVGADSHSLVAARIIGGLRRGQVRTRSARRSRAPTGIPTGRGPWRPGFGRPGGARVADCRGASGAVRRPNRAAGV